MKANRRSDRLAKEARRRAAAAHVTAAPVKQKIPRQLRWPSEPPCLPTPLDRDLHVLLESRGWVRFNLGDGDVDAYDWPPSRPDTTPEEQDDDWIGGFETYIKIHDPDCADPLCTDEPAYAVHYAQIEENGYTAKSYSCSADLIAEIDVIEAYRADQPTPAGATVTTSGTDDADPRWNAEGMTTLSDEALDLLDHLLDGEKDLWVPGAKPHARNQALMFEPELQPKITVRPHPLNPRQTPIIRGQLHSGLGARPYWGVALGHLAHTRGTCHRCESVWRAADEQWAGVPDAGSHEALFGCIEVGNRDQPGGLLIHIDDVPSAFYEVSKAAEGLHG